MLIAKLPVLPIGHFTSEALNETRHTWTMEALPQ